jgi:LCP family protein required for cell wall assembly
MFERFDDPVAFRPDAGFRAAVQRRGGALRRRRRFLAAGASSLAVVALVGGAGLYVDRRDDAIDRVEVSTEPSTDGATNVLLVGTDGPIADGARADSIAVLRFDDTGTRLLSIPRDLIDPGNPDNMLRINQALRGGPQAMVDAVARATGIPIDHYVAIEPQGFADLVDATGGLRVAVNRSLVDEATGLSLAPAECAELDGDTALALARARRIDASGDLGRVHRQQAMLGAALDQLDADPATIDQLSRLLADHAVVDDGLNLAGLVALGTRLASGPPLRTEVLPVFSPLSDVGSALGLAQGSAEVLESYGAVELPTAIFDQPAIDVTRPPIQRGEAPSADPAGDVGPCP